ncbi:MAG: DUF6273 domain-containing protein [Lachnospiraceae bacterium]|nr:DUF6273 domain-containing protein [Lachnospiraceae bacterium]
MKKQNMDSGFALEARPKASRGRKFAAITASVLAGAMLLTGTFAWSSISQRATNPLEGTPVEEGGRIHDHFDGSNKDVFAENFGGSPLLVRIQLREFLEFDGVSQVGTGALRDSYNTWPVHNPTGTPTNIGINTNGIGNYMSWTMGGQSTFMPTFNHQTTGNGGLQTEASGRAIDFITDGSTAAGANDGSANFWNVGEELTGTVSFNGGISATRTHVADNTLAPRAGIANNGVITMAQWQALPADNRVGNFWVIDTDGWAYWANILMPGTATSLLLDAIHPTMPNNVDWYYAIHVIGEFVTTDSRGDWAGSPFGAPSSNANGLMDQVADDITVHITSANTVQRGDTLNMTAEVRVAGTADPAENVTWSISDSPVPAGISIDAATGVLTVMSTSTATSVTVVASRVGGLESTEMTVNIIPVVGQSFTAGGHEWVVLSNSMGPGGHGTGTDLLVTTRFVIMPNTRWNPTHSTAGGYNASEMRNVILPDFYNSQSWAHSLALSPGTDTVGSWEVAPERTERTTSSGTPVVAGGLDGAFLLSEADVLQFMPNGTARQATLANGSAALWWLRSPDTSTHAMLVCMNGTLYNGAAGFTNDYRGIRPALLLSELP